MEALRELGLTKYEAAVYTALLKTGPTDAKRIAKASDVPPTAVYPNLKQLIAKGFVQQMSAETSLYEALDPKIAIPTMIERQNQSMQQRAQDALAQLSVVKPDPLAPREPVSIYEGMDSSYEIFQGFVQRVQKTLWIVGWRFGNTKYMMRHLKTLASLVKQGKDVRLITTAPNYADLEIIRLLKEVGVQVRYYPYKNFSVIIRDGEESKVSLKNQEHRHHTNLFVHDKDFTQTLTDYYLTIWRRAKRV
jgi:sugar-specific transcriptional regulator TrmB